MYNIFLLFLSPLLFFYLLFRKEKLGRTIGYRFGFIPDSLAKKLNPLKTRVWIHAVSVGEIRAIAGFIKELTAINPDIELVVSTITASGKQVAEENLKEAVLITYLPFDFKWAARRIMKIIKPDVFVTIETEIWPNMLREAKAIGASTLMINGRISPRSIDNYCRFKPFFQQVLLNYDLMSMIMPHDAERIITMGADKNKVLVSGNSKYDHLPVIIDKRLPDKVYQRLRIKKESLVLIGGSTRTGEEEILLNVYRRLVRDYPELLLILVPRHIERGESIKTLAEKGGFKAILKTEIDNGKRRTAEKVIIINTIGELFAIYSIGTLIFCGASLVPKGGQNIMEPAIWGKAVFYGPSMEDFIDARDLLETAGAGIEVQDSDDFYEKAAQLLAQPEKLKKLGEKARQAVLANKGASQKNARQLTKYLKGV